jgi:hypothetical protein
MLATAGDLVFTGDPEGNFFALNARTGEKLWNYETGAGHRGSAISNSVNGRQNIATPTGYQQSLTVGFVASMIPDQTFRVGSMLHVSRSKRHRDPGSHANRKSAGERGWPACVGNAVCTHGHLRKSDHARAALK